MTCFQLYVSFTITVACLIIFYYLILCNIDPYPVVRLRQQRISGLQHHSKQIHSNSSYGKEIPDSSLLHHKFLDRKSIPVIHLVKQFSVQEIHSFKSKMIEHLMHDEMSSAPTAMHLLERKRNAINFKKILCKIQFKGMDPTFPAIVHHGVYRVLPTKKLDSLLRSLSHAHDTSDGRKKEEKERRGTSCALISSEAPTIRDSQDAKFIDTHDIIVRINGSPVGNGAAKNLGTRTSIRLLDSHFFASDAFNISQPMFSDPVIVIWDNYTDENEPDARQLYRKYVSCRDNYPDVRMYILNPSAIRQVTRLLRLLSPNTQIQPSSDMIAFLLLMRFCSTVTAYDLIPSIRMSSPCQQNSDCNINTNCNMTGMSCKEKLLPVILNHASDYSVIMSGRSDYVGCIK